MASRPGRNDPCPCGSGLKYKHCCEDKRSWRDSPVIMGAGVVVLLLVGLVLLSLAFSDSDRSAAARQCPPGQVWSEAHGHCH